MATAYTNKAFFNDDNRAPNEERVQSAPDQENDNQITSVSIVVGRQLYTQPKFDAENAPKKPSSESICDKCLKSLRQCRCSGNCVLNFIYKYVPIVRIMSMYNIKTDLLADFTAGLTIGIMQIPQGMAYALLASLPAVVGLYTSFWPVLIYFIFGTSNHISMDFYSSEECEFNIMNARSSHTTDVSFSVGCEGTYAISSLMVAGSTEEFCSHIEPDSQLDGGSNNTNNSLTDSYNSCKIGVGCSIALLSGTFMVILGVLKLGWLTIYLSTPLTRGFTTASAIQVLTSQMKYIFGISMSRHSGPLSIIYIYEELFEKITSSSPVTLIISIISCLVLALIKEFFSPWFKRRLKLSFPIDLLVVIVATTVSYLGKFNEKYEVDILGEIPTGLPAPAVPEGLSANFIDLLPSAISIAIVGYANSMALGKLFAEKHGYQVDADQELLANGFSNVGGSFFSCYHAAPSMARTLVYEASGAVTQLTGAISCVLILLILMVMGPLFSDLPTCVLAAIIIVALKGMFTQFFDLVDLWGVDKIDLSIWVVTFLATLLLDVDFGLLVGVAFALLTVIYRTQRPRTAILGQVPQTDIYKSVKLYDAAQERPGIKIFRFESGLYYANHENFVKKLFQKCELNPREEFAQRDRIMRKQKATETKLWDTQAKSDTEQIVPTYGSTRARQVKQDHEVSFGEPEDKLHTIILDCSMMAFIDSVGVNALSQVIKAYDKVDIRVYLASCRGNVSNGITWLLRPETSIQGDSCKDLASLISTWQLPDACDTGAFRRTLDRAGFYKSHDRAILFLTVHDAVINVSSADSRQ